jgi:hypothetical protein
MTKENVMVLNETFFFSIYVLFIKLERMKDRKSYRNIFNDLLNLKSRILDLL